MGNGGFGRGVRGGSRRACKRMGRRRQAGVGRGPDGCVVVGLHVCEWGGDVCLECLHAHVYEARLSIRVHTKTHFKLGGQHSGVSWGLRQT